MTAESSTFLDISLIIIKQKMTTIQINDQMEYHLQQTEQSIILVLFWIVISLIRLFLI